VRASTVSAGRKPGVPPVAILPLLALAGLVAVALVSFAGGYGYHRDELYFLVAGEHLSWGYPDQGPVTPLLAHAMNAIAPGSLTVLRLPSALMAGATVFVSGPVCHELGGARRAQLIAAGCTAVASIVLVTGHLLSTTTLDLLAWSLVTWLIARAVRTGRHRLCVLAGAFAGVDLLNKPLIGFLLLALGVGLLLAGPRRVLRGRWPWVGLLGALLLCSPWLIWQQAHGWPQLEVSSSIAGGGSASSQPRWALLPFQFLLVSPVLAPVWVAGLLGLAREPRLRDFRFLAVAWAVLVVLFAVTGGKPYYLAGMFPALLAAGAIETDAWLARGSRRLRRTLLVAAIGLSAAVSATIALPILPESSLGPVIAVNGDVGETIGWPALVKTVAHVYRESRPAPVIFTSNYGEAGAIDRFGGAFGLPHAYSGHNGFSEWGPPPDTLAPVLVVGLSSAQLRRQFRGCRVTDRIGNPAGVDNQERGEAIDLCSGPRASWSQIWRALRHFS
jgi:4-amino-4-deoxy-L-arabinose transferase-like glycosyltransferase